MKKNITYSLVIAISAAGIISCNNRNNESDQDMHKDTVNVSDSRRNTTNSVDKIYDTTSKKPDINEQAPGTTPTRQ